MPFCFLVMKWLYLLLLLSPGILFSQRTHDAQWVLWDFSKLDFRTDTLQISAIPPNPFIGIGTYTNTMCDKKGNIIFQTGGCAIYNRLFKVMLNGDEINSEFTYLSWCGVTGDFPLKQSTLPLTAPEDSLRYLVFSYDFDDPFGAGGPLPVPLHLYYHVIDMSLDNGLGAITIKKQIAVQDTFSRGYLQAVHHANGSDWWVVAPKWNSNCYFIVPVTNTGVGTFHTDCIGQVWDDNDLGGQTGFSPDGTKYARIEGHNGLFVFDFDNENGHLLNPIKLEYPQPEDFTRGICFSPNSRYLYVSARLQLFQFDLWASDIQASMQLVGEIDSTIIQPGQSSLGLCKLGPDGRIYVASQGSHKFLSVINRPNCPGLASDFRQHAIELPEINYSGIPNLPHFGKISTSYDCEIIATKEPEKFSEQFLLITPNPTYEETTFSTQTPVQGKWDLLDVAGRSIESGDWKDTSMKIDVTGLQTGLYFFRLQIISGQVVVAKIVVQPR